jgi:Yip1-like protein
MTADTAWEDVRNSPWLTMWFRPRTTVSRLMSMETRPSWIPVVALAGLHQALLWASENYTYAVRHPGTAAGYALFFGGVALVYGLVIAPWLIVIIGHWFGGQGDPADVRLAVAWSMVPMAFSFLAWIPLFAALGWQALDPWGLEPAAQWLAMLPFVIFPIWMFVLQVASFAAALRFSIWRALACLVILIVLSALLRGLMRLWFF